MKELQAPAALGIDGQAKRIEWIDIARGIAIFLVCLGHRDTPWPIVKWLYSFHMPAFFIISGYVTKFSVASHDDFAQFLKRKAKGLLVPYLCLGFCFIGIQWLYSTFLHRDYDFLRAFLNLLIGHDIGSSWFVIALFVTELLAYGIHRLTTKSWIRWIITAICAVVGFSLNYLSDTLLPLNINAALIGLGFFEFGYASRNHRALEFLCSSRKRGLFVFLASLVVGVVCTAANERVNMFYLKYGVIPLFYIGAASGTIVLVIVSVFLEKKTNIFRCFFRYYGKNTWPIIEFHYVQGYMVLETISFKVFHVVYRQNVLSGNIEGFLYAICVLFLLTPIIELLNRYLPWMVGKKKERKK